MAVIPRPDALSPKRLQRLLAYSGCVAQIAVQYFAAHEVDYLARGVVGAGIVTLVSLIEVLENAPQQLWIGVHRLVVGSRFTGSEAVTGKQAEQRVVVLRVEHLVRQRYRAGVVDAILQRVPAEQSAVEVRDAAEERVLAAAAAAGRHRVEEQRDEEATVVFVLRRIRYSVPQIREINDRAFPIRLSEPPFGLEEPEEEDAAHLASGPCAGIILAERFDDSVILIMRLESRGHAVPDGSVFLVELGGNALDAELLLPRLRYLQQARVR